MASRELELILRLRDEATKELQGFNSKLQSMKPQFQKMVMVGTAAFAAVGAGAYKATQAAIDAQEIFNRFDVVFGDVGDQAEAVAQDLRNNFGLAESSAKDLLSSTGDMLTGFGMSGQAALDLSEKTNKLAVDLASFTNIEGGADRASQALTKALLGERESVKELGIAILEEDVNAKVEAMKVAGEFTNETEREMKAIATLEIAMEQSKNAIGDYARTQDSAANQQRVQKEITKELSEAIGKTLIPIISDLKNKIEPVIKNITNWIKENEELTRKIILAAGAISGIIAVLGLLGIAIITISPAIGALTTAWIGLNVATLGYVAIAEVIAVAILLVGRKLKEVADSVGGFRNLWEWAWLQIEYVILKVTESIMGAFEGILRMIPVVGDSFGSFFDFLDRRIAENRGYFSDLANRAMPEVSKAAEETGESLGDLGNNFKEVMNSASQAAGGTSESLNKIQQDVENINKEIADTNERFNDLMRTEEDNFYNDLARKVAQYELDVETMREQAVQAEKEGNDEKAKSLFEQVNAKQKELNDFYTWDMDISADVAWEKEKLQMGELERTRVEYLEKKKLMLEDQVEALRLLQERKEEKEKEAQSEITLIETTKTAHIQAEQEKTKVTEIELKKREYLRAKAERILSSARSSVGSSINSTVETVRDAIITPQGQVIQTDPSDYLIATKTPGALAGGVVINIDKVIGSDRRTAESFANEIARIIKKEVKY